MTAVRRFEPRFAASVPAHLEPGVLYVSIEYATAMHLCACGCGREVVTPLAPDKWSLTYDGAAVSLRPSVGNWSYPCRSHYWIGPGGRVRWDRTWSDAEVALARGGPRSRSSHAPQQAMTPDRLWARWKGSPAGHFASSVVAGRNPSPPPPSRQPSERLVASAWDYVRLAVAREALILTATKGREPRLREVLRRALSYRASRWRSPSPGAS
jgi:hypothetical protein